MKRLNKSLLTVQLAAWLLLPAVPATAGVAVPFKGAVEAQESYELHLANDPPLMSVDASGAGNATHLGQFTATWELVVNLASLEGRGSALFVARNRDRLRTEVLGQAIPTEIPDVFVVIEDHTITGGTGRFEGASGSFQVERLVNTATGVTAGSFNGSLVLHKAK